MSASITTTQAIGAWIDDNRRHAPLLDDDADALLARLYALNAQAQALDALAQAPCTIG